MYVGSGLLTEGVGSGLMQGARPLAARPSKTRRSLTVIRPITMVRHVGPSNNQFQNLQ